MPQDDTAQPTQMMDNADLKLAERRLNLEEEMQRREMIIKEREASRTPGLSQAQASIIGVLLTVLGGFIGAGVTAWTTRAVEVGRNQTSLQIEERRVKGELALERSKQQATEDLERKKFETTLILEAVKTSSREEAIRNLRFFVNAGFVSDPDKKISNLSESEYPSFGEPSQESRRRALESTGLVLVSKARKKIKCAGTLISPLNVVTASVCVNPISDSRLSQSAKPSISFMIGGEKVSASVVREESTSEIALLKLETSIASDLVIQRSSVREPVRGEAIYLAFQASINKDVQFRTCNVTSRTEEIFMHSCKTDLGSAGALVIATKDDAILGMHYASSEAFHELRLGVAANMVKVLSQFAPYLRSSSKESKRF